MIINDKGCICGTCLRSGYCVSWKDVVNLQRVAFSVPPKDMVLVIQVESCPNYYGGGNENGDLENHNVVTS